MALGARIAPPAGNQATFPYRPPTGRAKPFYHPELDTVRFFLFCAVWGYHALPRDARQYSVHHVPAALASLITTAIQAGMCSLDVFFILSAFLITELLLRERESWGTVDLRAVYSRRILPVWACYVVV